MERTNKGRGQVIKAVREKVTEPGEQANVRAIAALEQRTPPTERKRETGKRSCRSGVFPAGRRTASAHTFQEHNRSPLIRNPGKEKIKTPTRRFQSPFRAHRPSNVPADPG